MEDLSARASDAGARSPRQRYSDEARETNKLKKKSGFSSFMNNLVGTPRKPTISAPENPVHVTHVGYDQNTGEFTGLPREWQKNTQSKRHHRARAEEKPTSYH